mmetsp:Transcript_10367/g.16671  ORF Transcript_10367/g.16671 Transcript_10367/m.16671 type:complete len:120 (+) Transcript_10367:892-1251(+)
MVDWVARTVSTAMVVVTRRIGPPQARRTVAVVVTVLVMGCIVGLGGARLDFALLSVDDDISCFAWDGREEGIGKILCGKCHKPEAAASLGEAIDDDNGIDDVSELLEEFKKVLVRYIGW